MNYTKLIFILFSWIFVGVVQAQQPPKNNLEKSNEDQTLTFGSCEYEPCDADGGEDQTVCIGTTIRLGQEECPGHTYRWFDSETSEVLATTATFEYTVSGDYIENNRWSKNNS